MQFIKPLGFISGLAVIVSCFFPWVYIGWKGITTTGVNDVSNFRQPGYFHIGFTILCLFFFILRKVWTRIVSILFAVLNFAWMLRNFLRLSTCDGGECPERLIGLYVLIAASTVMLFVVLTAPEGNSNKLRDNYNI
jgi:hypothetical protein